MNTPNKITLVRLLLLPIIIFFYLADFVPYGKLVATIVFIIAALTDALDGHIARKHNLVTDLGKFFDAIADKVLIMTGMILIISGPLTGSAPVVYPSWLGIICVIIMLAREFIISALRQVAATKGKVLAAENSGKIKATIQDIAVIGYMAFAFVIDDIIPITQMNETALAAVRFILMILFVVATVLTIYSGTSYLIKNRKVFVDEKARKDNAPSNFKNNEEQANNENDDTHQDSNEEK